MMIVGEDTSSEKWNGTKKEIAGALAFINLVRRDSKKGDENKWEITTTTKWYSA